MPDNTVYPDHRTMRFGNPPRDREAKTGSGFPGARLVRTVEPFENKRQIFLGYADAGIFNLSDSVVKPIAPS